MGKELGKEIMKARTARGISVDDLAGYLALNVSRVECFESGEEEPSFYHARKICDYLDVPYIKSKIEWTDATWNPVRGCTKISYEHGFDLRLVPEKLSEPLKWKKPRRISVNSMSDLFHEDVPFGYVMRCLWVMVNTPHHLYQILTKRSDRMRDFWERWSSTEGEDYHFKNARGPEASRAAHPSPRGQLFADMLDSMGIPPSGAAYPLFDWMEGMITWPDAFFNVWLGVSVEDQRRAEERIFDLVKTPASRRFLSVEPLLGPVDLTCISLGGNRAINALNCDYMVEDTGEVIAGPPSGAGPIDWVIVGGESGPGARPMNPEWVKQIRDQCVLHSVPFFFKQWGGINKKKTGRELDGRTWDEMPGR